MSEITAPPFSSKQIITAAEKLTSDFYQSVGPAHLRLNGLRFEDVYEKIIYLQYGIEIVEDEELGSDESGRMILGRFEVCANTAFISRMLGRDLGDPRRTFTLWHEIGGHGVLQGEWLRNQMQPPIIVTEDSLSADTTLQLERQANVFAANAAAPGWFVEQVVRYMIPGRECFPFYAPCEYWLNVQGVQTHRYVADFWDLCQLIAREIGCYFGGLSAEALGYRLAKLGIVVDRSRRDLHLFRRSTEVTEVCCVA